MLPRDVRWHFIGQLQSNKAKALVTGVPNLWAIESVDSVKLASKLDAASSAAGRVEPLRVFVQVNTTGEPQKGGVEDAAEAISLCRFIREECPRLRLMGLMTVGKWEYYCRCEFLVSSKCAHYVRAHWRHRSGLF